MLQSLVNDDQFNRLIGVFVYHRSVSIPTNTTGQTSATIVSSKPTRGRSSFSKMVTDSNSTGSSGVANVSNRRSVNVLNYQNHVKQVAVYMNEDIFRFQVQYMAMYYDLNLILKHENEDYARSSGGLSSPLYRQVKQFGPLDSGALTATPLVLFTADFNNFIVRI